MSCAATVLFLSIGDCGPKSKNLMDTSSVSSSIMNQLQSSSSTSTSNDIIIQDQKIDYHDNTGGRGCNLDIYQKVNFTYKPIDTTNVNFKTALTSNIQSTINSNLDAFLSSNKGSLAGADGASLINEIKSQVQNTLATTQTQNAIVDKIRNSMAQQNQSVQITVNPVTDAEGNIQGAQAPYNRANCKIDQSFMFEDASVQTTNLVMDQLSKNEQLIQNLNKLSSKMESKSEGLSDIVSALASPLIIIAIIGLGAFKILNTGNKTECKGEGAKKTCTTTEAGPLTKYTYIAIGVIVIILIIGIIYVVYKKLNTTEKETEPTKDQNKIVTKAEIQFVSNAKDVIVTWNGQTMQIEGGYKQFEPNKVIIKDPTFTTEENGNKRIIMKCTADQILTKSPLPPTLNTYIDSIDKLPAEQKQNYKTYLDNIISGSNSYYVIGNLVLNDRPIGIQVDKLLETDRHDTNRIKAEGSAKQLITTLLTLLCQCVDAPFTNSYGWQFKPVGEDQNPTDGELRLPIHKEDVV